MTRLVAGHQVRTEAADGLAGYQRVYADGRFCGLVCHDSAGWHTLPRVGARAADSTGVLVSDMPDRSAHTRRGGVPVSDERATMLLAPLMMLAAVAVGLLVGLVFAVNSLRVTEPWCPTEDSCVATYQSGGWHITEVTP